MINILISTLVKTILNLKKIQSFWQIMPIVHKNKYFLMISSIFQPINLF